MVGEDLTREPELESPPYPPGTEADAFAADGADTPDEDLEECEVFAVEMMEATATALGSVSAIEFAARQSAIGSADVGGDAEVSGSLVGVVNAGSVGLYQGAAVVILANEDAAIEQGATQVLVTRSADLERSGAGVIVTREAHIARSWVGVMAARNATLSEGSRVLVDARAALIIGALLFGGLGLLAMGVYLGARHVAARIPHLPWAGHRHPAHRALPTPHLPRVQLPDMARLADIPQLAGLIAKLHRG